MENLTLEELNNLPLEDKVRYYLNGEESKKPRKPYKEFYLKHYHRYNDAKILAVAKIGTDPDEYNMSQLEFNEFRIKEIVNILNGVDDPLITLDELDSMSLVKRIRYINYLLISTKDVHEPNMIRTLLIPKYEKLLGIILKVIRTNKKLDNEHNLYENEKCFIEDVIKELNKTQN